ncbi:hypothetical protein GF325_12540, partial [Candidatus Bathyarchaeota archaeon]|nr:hypothetical protein [Candidatus Bathyarchaeota archaeon]
MVPHELEEKHYQDFIRSGEIKRLRETFRSSDISPFDSTSYLPDNEFEEIFIGRAKERKQIIDLVLATVEDGGCRAIKLKGQGGVGKTTLFNSIMRQLNRERTEGGTRFNRLGQTHQVFATFFPMDPAYENLAYIWQKMFEGLSDRDSDFFVNLALKFVLKLINLLANEPGECEKLVNILFRKTSHQPERPDNITLIDLRGIRD